jgi:hypothetical protein
MEKNKDDKWFFLPTEHIEVKDPSREACIIYIDKNDQEISREYFGINARIIKNPNYDK